jgi:hypothetical protein
VRKIFIDGYEAEVSEVNPDWVQFEDGSWHHIVIVDTSEPVSREE